MSSCDDPSSRLLYLISFEFSILLALTAVGLWGLL
jgi:hypothetical protein